ncbi:MAG: signal peptidase II, partial [Raoultibacter sp.]
MDQTPPVSDEKVTKRGRVLLIFAAIAGLWLAIDMATKSFFNNAFEPGDIITEPIMGLFRFRLVHNTGAAWGMFGDSTFALGIMSLIVCALLFAYLFYAANEINKGQ